MRKLLLILVLIPLLISCCKNKANLSNEGIITYKIRYSDEVLSKSFASFLPTQMISTFKENDYKLTIKGNISLYKLEYISRAQGDSSSTLFRIFDKRMFYNHKKGEHLFLFENFEKTKLEYFDSEIKTIAGRPCKKVVVHFNNPELKSITVYYTEDLRFKRPKENSPFDKIPGTLMEFSLEYKGLNLTFEAERIDLKKINRKVFLIPENYALSEHGEIGEIVGALIQ